MTDCVEKRTGHCVECCNRGRTTCCVCGLELRRPTAPEGLHNAQLLEYHLNAPRTVRVICENRASGQRGYINQHEWSDEGRAARGQAIIRDYATGTELFRYATLARMAACGWMFVTAETWSL